MPDDPSPAADGRISSNLANLFRRLTTDPATIGTAALLGALAGGGGSAYLTSREPRRPGETAEERRQRLIRNAALGAALGGGSVGAGLYGAGLLSHPMDRGPAASVLNRALNWGPLGMDFGKFITGTAGGGAAGLGLGAFSKPRLSADDINTEMGLKHKVRTLQGSLEIWPYSSVVQGDLEDARKALKGFNSSRYGMGARAGRAIRAGGYGTGAGAVLGMGLEFLPALIDYFTLQRNN